MNEIDDAVVVDFMLRRVTIAKLVAVATNVSELASTLWGIIRQSRSGHFGARAPISADDPRTRSTAT
jgi:hypothetical protein